MQNLNMKTLTLGLLSILALALLGVPLSVVAQQETLFVQVTQTGPTTMKDVLNDRITFSRVTWYPGETVTDCSFKMEESDDGTTWSDLTPVQDCSSNAKGRFEFVTPILGHFVRFNIITRTGAGFINILWEGFIGTKCGLDYRGVFSTMVSSDPATGAEVSVTIPIHERWRVYAAAFKLQADTSVADREVFLTASSGGNEYFRSFADGVVKADQEGIFTASSLGFVGTAGLGPSSINQSLDVRTIMIPIYSEAFIPGGDTLATDTNGMQAGDDYSPVVIKVEVCPN
ncbi:MAG: hypothetical protein V3W37_10395 [Candidatus Binatia bacterium]